MKQIIFVLMMSLCLSANGQTDDQKLKDEFKAVNNYVEFLNKSVHGLFVIHKLLEIENQEINKFVDIESHKLYNISNGDISSNVFTENSFYEKQLSKTQSNPFELVELAQKESSFLPTQVATKWNAKTLEIKKVLEQTNQIRYEIESYLGSNDLTDRTQVYGAYEIMEKAKNLFFTFYTLQLDFYHDLEKFSKLKSTNKDQLELFVALTELHENSRLILDALRFRNDNSFEKLTNDLKTSFVNYQEISKKYSTELKYAKKGINENLKKINGRVKKVIDSAIAFMETGSVADKYKQYGKYYHYHNNLILADMDWFGAGFINEMNDIIDKLQTPAIKYLEIPLFFQVIYPMKMDSVGHIASTDPLIDKIPTKLKNRKIKESNHIIHVDSNVVVLKLFDHLLQDGDIVSINFNGDWILEKHSIEKKSTELTLKLNPNGKNFLLMHADSEGRRPPNTMGIKYTYQGENKEIELRSDLNSSELIEIVNANQ